MASYIDIETPTEIVPHILDMLSVAKDGGSVKKGVNETTKSIERKTAKFVVVATDVSPEEIVVHLPMLCKEKGIPYAFVPAMKDLGNSIGISKGTSSVAVENPGAASEKLADILKRMPKATDTRPEPKKEEPVKEEKPKEEKKPEAPKPKEEKPKEEKKPEAPKPKEEKPKEEKPKEAPKPKEEKPKEEKKPEAPKPKEEKPKEEPKKEEKPEPKSE